VLRLSLPTSSLARVLVQHVGYEDRSGITSPRSASSLLQPFCEDDLSLFAVCRASRALAAAAALCPGDVVGAAFTVIVVLGFVLTCGGYRIVCEETGPRSLRHILSATDADMLPAFCRSRGFAPDLQKFRPGLRTASAFRLFRLTCAALGVKISIKKTCFGDLNKLATENFCIPRSNCLIPLSRLLHGGERPCSGERKI
jgi:hypothetical protein